jgi:hypothetical protein
MSVALSELYQVEKHVEAAFRTILEGVGSHIYVSREQVDIESNRLELKCKLGESIEHRRIFTNGDQTHDTWEAQLEITVASNRGEITHIDNHSALLGETRKRMTLRYSKHNLTSDVIEITDIRDTGTVDSFSDDNNIDITVLTYYLVVAIRPEAWPEF